MEQAQNVTPGMVWYNCNPVEGVLTSGTPVQVEIGPDIARQLNQQVQIQYGNFTTTIPTQPQQQHIILTHHPSLTQDVTPSQAGDPDAEETTNSQSQKAVTSQPQLKVRMKPKAVSVGERVTCPQCRKTFSCNANLRDHIRLHTGERPFSCSECGMSFAQRSNWRLHKRVHTGERPYMCGICGKTFSRSSHLPGHMRVHTGERPFPCDMCDNAFGSAQALKNHMRTHTGEKPFVCNFCRTPFTHSSSLSSHKKRCNGEKRKRGRPLGSGRRTFKKKATTGRRGRPKKRSGGKFQKKGRTKKLKLEASSSPSPLDDDKEAMQTIVLNGQETSIKIEAAAAGKPPVQSELMEISVEAIDPSAAAGKNRREESEASCELLAQDGSGEVKPNESEGLSILPDSGAVLLEEDVVRAAASAAGLTDPADLHQEAAVTMAALQHGALNLVQSATSDQFATDHAQNAAWYLKQN